MIRETAPLLVLTQGRIERFLRAIDSPTQGDHPDRPWTMVFGHTPQQTMSYQARDLRTADGRSLPHPDGEVRGPARGGATRILPIFPRLGLGHAGGAPTRLSAHQAARARNDLAADISRVIDRLVCPGEVFRPVEVLW